jgi:thiamine pyrophosphate-dependent acetolactate synthase large subunit-like protein
LRLADATGYAVAVTPDGKGLFPEDHPSFIGEEKLLVLTISLLAVVF